MASRPMVPHSFPGLLEDTWPGMPQWSTLVLHHTCRRQQSRKALQLSRQSSSRPGNECGTIGPLAIGSQKTRWFLHAWSHSIQNVIIGQNLRNCMGAVIIFSAILLFFTYICHIVTRNMSNDR